MFSNMKNFSVYICYPSTDEPYIKSVVHTFSWAYQDTVVHEHMFTKGDAYRYRTPYNTEVIMQAIIVHLPRYYLHAAKVRQLTCGNKSFSTAYALYSGAVYSYHIPRLPLLKLYDFLVKLDSDVWFSQAAPDIGHEMQRKQCLVGHTSVKKAAKGCEAESFSALQNFSIARGVQIKSANAPWCNKDGASIGAYFYANVIAFSTSFIQDPLVLELGAFLYEEWQHGYFDYRWTDQAPFMLYLCIFAEINALTTSPLICDFSCWRNVIFSHAKVRDFKQATNRGKRYIAAAKQKHECYQTVLRQQHALQLS